MELYPRQKICSQIGESGCLFDDIVKAAELLMSRPFDIVEVYRWATKTRHVDGKTVIDDNCYVWHPEMIMEHLVGGKWAYRHEVKEYARLPGDIIFFRYESGKTMQTLSHFCLELEDGTIYDPYGESVVRRIGKLVSKRVLRRV